MTEAHELEALLYEAGELDGVRAAAFEAHVKGCAACRETLALAGRAHLWGAALAEGPAPETLASALLRETARPWTPVLRLAFAVGLACAALAFVARVERPAPDLSWKSDLPSRIWTLQQRLGDARVSAGELRTETESWEREVKP
jgi:hypothetical protein